MNEIWKEIPGYEGYFEVSNLGNFRSMDRMVKYKNKGLRKYPGKPLKVEKNQKKLLYKYIKGIYTERRKRQTFKYAIEYKMNIINYEGQGKIDAK